VRFSCAIHISLKTTGIKGQFGWSGIAIDGDVLLCHWFDAVSTAAQEDKNPQRMPISILGY
jgi:hypothetical protein